MQIEDLITELTPTLAPVGIELDRKKAPAFIRKLASDKLISSPPRYAKSGPKGRGAPSDWPETAIQEIAAYFCVQNLRRDSDARIPRSIIRKARQVGFTLMTKPQELCWIEVDENGEIDIDWSSDFVLAPRYLRPVGGPGLRFPNDEKTTLSIDKQVDFLLSDLEDFLLLLMSEPKQKPDCFCEAYPGQVDELLEKIYLVRKRRELAVRPPLEFTVIPEAATWIATFEKVAQKIPLSEPVDLEYRWNVDVKLNKKSPNTYYDTSEESDNLRGISPSELEQTAKNQNDEQMRNGTEITYTFERLVVKKHIDRSETNLRVGPEDQVYVYRHVPQQSVYVHYNIELQ